MTHTAAHHREEPARHAGWRLPALRIGTGLVLFAFVLTHFLNHALGLVSVAAMDTAQELREAVTRSLPGTIVLAAAAVVHMLLGLSKLATMRIWRIRPMEAVQLAFGVLIPLLLFRHILGTRGVHELFGIDDTYEYALWAMWPGEALNQAILMGLVWVHSCIGLHRWLMLKNWYRQSFWLWYGLALLLPVLSFAGFAAAARAARLASVYANPFSPEQYQLMTGIMSQTFMGYALVLAAAVASWLGLLLFDRYRHKVAISYMGGPTVHVSEGLTLLEASRVNRIPHASVCGGRARCSTCRVRVIEGLERQPPALENELRVLRRVGAPDNVRLACQLRPAAALKISTLLPASVDVSHGAYPDKYLWGVEQDVTVMFADLRGFTKLSEGRLSFDVVFLLNQFLGRMGEAIEDSGGYVDKFMGDGIMAIFGMDEPAAEGAAKAVRAARAMGGVLDALNQSLREELAQPLEIGIGIHAGPAILGRIGAASHIEAASRITALGETVNTASRLESLTKELGVQIVVSKRAASLAKLEAGAGLAERSVDIRGLSRPLDVLTVKKATAIAPEDGIAATSAVPAA
jgi:adenylate cyclase